MKKSLNLLDQIIEVAKHEDVIRRRNTAAQDYIGEDWTLYHLKSLKELIILENAESNDNKRSD
jgi:hypothetical protein